MDSIDQKLAKKAYQTWDTFGGRALGNWGAPYVEEAWIEVVKDIREALAAEARDAS